MYPPALDIGDDDPMDFSSTLRKRRMLSAPFDNQEYQDVTGKTPEPDPTPDSTTSKVSDQTTDEDPEFGPYTKPQPTGRKSFADTYKEITQLPVGPAQKRYNDFLAQNEPNRSDYKPSKMTGIGAILSSVGEGVRGNPARGQAILDQEFEGPYNRALADWKTKSDKLRAAADTEDKDIHNRILTFRDIIQQQNDDARNANTAAGIASKADTADKDRALKGWKSGINTETGMPYSYRVDPDTGEIEFKQGSAKVGQTAKEVQTDKMAIERAKENARVAIEKLKIANPNLKPVMTKGGDIMVFNPKTGEMEDSGIDTGTWTDKDKADFAQKNAIARIEARGDQARKTKTTAPATAPDKTTTTEYKDKDGNVIATKTVTVKSAAGPVQKKGAWMKNPQTGEVAFVPEENLKKAIAALYTVAPAPTGKK